MKNIIIYHSADCDGIGSAALVSWYLGDGAEKKFYGLNYESGFDPKIVDKDTDVWIVDYGFSPILMVEFVERANRVHFYDHHPRSMDLLKYFDKDKVDYNIRMSRSAIGLVWESLFKGPEPNFVKYIEDIDLWLFKYENTKAYNEWLVNIFRDPNDMVLLKRLIEEDKELEDEILEKGKVLLSVKENRMNRAIKNGYYGKVKGFKAYFVNSTTDHSEIGNKVAMMHTEPIVAVIYNYMGKNRVYLSFRSSSINVREIAEKLGGGGHVAASGAIIEDDRVEWTKKLGDYDDANRTSFRDM